MSDKLMKDEDGYDMSEAADDDASTSGYGLGSCQTCKNRKVKCDKIKPACGRCLKRGLECTYRYKQKPGLKAGYGKELTERMDFLEEQTSQNNQMLKNITETLALLTQKMTGSPAARIQVPAVPGSFAEDMSTPGSPSTMYDTALTSELVDLYFERIHPFFPILHETSTRKTLRTAIDSSSSGVTSSTGNTPLLLYSIIAITLRFMPETRMSQQEKRVLYNYCKETVILHSFEIKKVSTLQALAVLALDLVGISNGPQTWSILPLICSAALHLGLAKEPEEARSYSSEYPNREHTSLPDHEGYHGTPIARSQDNNVNDHRSVDENNNKHDNINNNNTNINDNINDNINGEDDNDNDDDNDNENESGEGEGAEAEGNETESQWLTASSASILPNTHSWSENEARRRLFWGVYILDRILSVSTAFSFKLSSLEIHRRLPMKESLWLSPKEARKLPAPTTRWFKSPNLHNTDVSGPNSYLDEFGYMIENLQILSSIHEFLKTPVSIYSLSEVVAWQVKYRQLDIELDNWFRSLPEEVSNIQKSLFYKEISPMSLMLHSVYLTSVIRLNSSAGYSRLRSEYFTVSPSAARKCLVASSGVADLARHAILFGTWQKLGPHFAWTVWVSARLLIVDCVTNRKPLPNDLESLLTLLDNMGKCWVVAARYHTMLTMVLDEQLALRTSNGEEQQQKEQEKQQEESEDKKRRTSKAEILADMSRNAYALDFILSGKTSLKKRKLNHQSRRAPNNASNNASTTDTVDRANTATSPLASHVINSNEMLRPEAVGRDNMQHMETGGVPPTVLGQANEMANTDIFDWFNWPKRLYDSKEAVYPVHEHSVDEYKTILSRDELVDVYGMNSTEGDWLNEAQKAGSQRRSDS